MDVQIKEKDLILLLEDNEGIIVGFQQWLQDEQLNIEFHICRNYEEYELSIANEALNKRVKCLIIDLSNNKEEEVSSVFKSVNYINKTYNENRIPIFIHSGFLEKFQDLKDKGTVFKVLKDTRSIETIGNTIKTLLKSGFLHIFSSGGSLESKIMKEVHSAFVEQFKPKEIEDIISSISDTNNTNVEARTTEIFERIALRAVYQNTISNSESNNAIKVNAIEHYYRRINRGRHVYWTGDIFKNTNGDTNELFFLATPRCNISNENFENLLLFKIKPINEENLGSFLNTKEDNKKTGETKGEKVLRTSITDDVTNSIIGERFRFLPKTPQFVGGFVDCMKCKTISKEDFLHEYEYVISLVDDLTNDVVRKVAAYLLRGGISDTDYKEAMNYVR